MTRYYTKDHEWLAVSGDTATVGITDYAQGQLGDVVFVELPPVGSPLTKGKEAAVVESVKAASEVYAPVSGSVTEGNPELEADPALVNTAPEDGGWFFRMTVGDTSGLDGLMDEAAYRAMVADLRMGAAHGQQWDPAAYQAHGSFVPALGAPVLEILAPKPGERILDLGCGDGVLTEKLAAAGATVVGVDADRAMVAAAKERGLDARRMDGRALEFATEFDAVFTNAALHWMPPPELVADGVFRALKPGGRYVGEFGGHGNVAAIRAALRGVLMRRGYRVPSVEDSYYPTAEEFTAVLAGAGFEVVSCQIIPRPTPLPSGMSAWLHTFRSGFIDDVGVPPAERGQVIEDTRSMLRPILADRAGNWMADYVRCRFAARKPE